MYLFESTKGCFWYVTRHVIISTFLRGGFPRESDVIVENSCRYRTVNKPVPCDVETEVERLDRTTVWGLHPKSSSEHSRIYPGDNKNASYVQSV